MMTKLIPQNWFCKSRCTKNNQVRISDDNIIAAFYQQLQAINSRILQMRIIELFINNTGYNINDDRC